MARSKLTRKGQTTVPKTVREALGLEAGDSINWEIDGCQVRVSSPEEHPFFKLQGFFKTGPGDVVQDVKRARQTMGIERYLRSLEE